MKTINKKNRITSIICVIMMIILMTSPLVYAEGEDDIDATEGTQTATKELNLRQSFPADKDNRLQVDNTGIKLFFDGNVIDESVWENNQTKFSLATKKGKEIKTKAYSSEKAGTDYILVVVDAGQSLTPKTDYIFTIKAGLQSKEGQVLSQDIVLNFTTVDVEGNTKVNMGLMGLMVVGMIGMTVFSSRRQQRKTEEKKEDKVNPYKIAKDTGKSVEEVMAQIEKDKAKKAKRLAKNGNGGSAAEEVDDGDVYKVKGPRRISDAGSTYKTGRKALAEKKAREAAARKAKGTTNPKKKGGKKKGKKK